jgi:hypothetical protein
MGRHIDRRNTRVAKGTLVGLLAVGALLVVGPANGSPSGTPAQPPAGTHVPTKADPPATHQPAPGTHTSTVSPGARTATHQPVS